MFKNLPSTSDSILAMEWADYEPHFKVLESTTLTADNITEWLSGWSALADKLDEQYTRLFVATTQHTTDEDIEKRFNHFVEAIQPQARIAEQKLKEMLLSSGLQPANFKMGLKVRPASTVTKFARSRSTVKTPVVPGATA